VRAWSFARPRSRVHSALNHGSNRAENSSVTTNHGLAGRRQECAWRRRCTAWLVLPIAGLASCAATVVLHAAPATRDTIRFSGLVHRAETYRHTLRNGLEFRLTPMAGVSDGSWRIGVWPGDSVAIDYAAVATPPFRGMNPRYIEGWHFRNQRNTGPNLGDVNAPQEEREFQFVESRAAFDSCYAAVERVMWPFHLSEAVVERAGAMLDSLSTGTGTLLVTALWLTAPLEGAQAEIDSMRFEVILQMTRARRDSSRHHR
jgi:hypothetical protein